MPQKNVSLTEHHDQFIDRVLNVYYGNVSEVVRSALNLLEKEIQQKELNDEILFQRELDKGVRAYHEGEYTSYDTLEEFSQASAKQRDEWKRQLKK